MNTETCLLLLEDHNVRLLSAAKEYAASPGYAALFKEKPIFGQQAQELARLAPRDCYSHFWSQLSLDPLPIKNKYFRHHADIAYGHLQALLKEQSFQSTILAVPSHYSKNQLSILLGIAQSFTLGVSGLVDLNLLRAASAIDQNHSTLVIDLQLQQTVLSLYVLQEGMLSRTRAQVIPGLGLQNLQDAWTNTIAECFIKQTRFDPKHGAEPEQYLYNQLPNWFLQLRRQNDLQLALNYKGSTYEAVITAEALSLSVVNLLNKLIATVNDMLTEDCSILIQRNHLSLPGLTSALPGINGIDDVDVINTLQAVLAEFEQSDGAINFISKLPTTALTQQRRERVGRQATHVLLGNKAITLPQGLLVLGTCPEISEAERVLPLKELPLGASVSLRKTQTQLILNTMNIDNVLFNGKPVHSEQCLFLGDSVQLSFVDQEKQQSSLTLSFIEVD
jgi:hypothetical protein